MSGLRYVYAVCRPFGGALQTDVRGILGAPPETVREGDLVAVVSTVPESDFAEEPLREHLEDLDWLAATARGHQAVVAALTTVTSPLPLRLGTVYRDDSGVRVMLKTDRDRFLYALDRLDNRVEWGVKVYAEESPASPDALTDAGTGSGAVTGSGTGPGAHPGRSAGGGRDYLQRRLRERRSQESTRDRAEALARHLHGELSRLAESALLHRPQNPRLSSATGTNVLNAAYLVHRAESEAFVEHVEKLGEESAGVRVELTGPWAPYSFTNFFTDEQHARTQARHHDPEEGPRP
ncbi:GvpL/GvpF family gas vesicle protein [Streptomyces sp. GC420]|uniref:GvpL/GvpF family gas vesicle protein n=1 Tax=Streptomyces sp. GC420 TaxID=2697568 RepID=UPI0014152376|nr:GvpL/GvpF family gas vesicle protein [Streptomyces sp. GC420]NBM20136.1 gas vesicle protein [Streptomyces sp. GC420]